MKVIFSGTGSSTGTPQLFCDCKVCLSENPKNKRTRFSLIIQELETTLVVDTPFELRLQLLRAEIQKVDAIWLTHPHSDHIAGIDDTRIISFKNQASVKFFAGRSTIDNAKKRFPYMFLENEYLNRPFLDPVEIGTGPFRFKDLSFIPVNHMHGSMEVNSFRTGDFAFLADFSEIDPAEIEKLKGVKVLSVCTTVKHPHYKHMELDKVIALIKKIGPEQAFLTHMNHTFDHETTASILPSFIKPAYDGLEILV
jgi:phosphoribosyl 1,2-cyclic phosphate phosphodiesterase